MASQMLAKSKQILRKLTLWHTVTFRPIFTHDDLEPIMVKAGFVPNPKPAAAGADMVAWQEYGYGAIRELPDHVPRVRLPFPEIDGTHVYTLRYFLEAMAFYLGTELVCNILHIRSISVKMTMDIVKSYRKMKDCGIVDNWIYLYRDGTLDEHTRPGCSSNNEDGDCSIKCNMNHSRHPMALRRKYRGKLHSNLSSTSGGSIS